MSHVDYLDLVQPKSLLSDFQPLTPEEVQKVILKMSSASCILDPVPTKVVKQCITSLRNPITHIVNTSITSGEFATKRKQAVVAPLIKNSSLPPILSNFRPVSNLQHMSKVVEKVVVDQLTRHLEANCPLPSVQSAYRPNFSTETLLLKIQTDILTAMDEQKLTLIVLLDLSAAFDTVDHKILLDILRWDFGVEGCALKWFKSYLEYRTQYILIDGQASDTFELQSGVPQGSCLGPLCFTVYASSLFKVIKRHLPEGFGYADDTQLLHSFHPNDLENETGAFESIQNCVLDINKWMAAHKLKLNNSKTELMFLGTSAQLHKLQSTSIDLGDVTIKSVPEVRNLGVLFDCNLTMENHVNKICKTGYYNLRNLWHIRHHMTSESLTILVNAFIHSHMDYGNSLQYGISNKLINRLQKLQNAAARLVTNSRKDVSSRKLLQTLHWLPIRSRIQFKILTLVYRCLHDQAPTYLSDLLSIKDPSTYSLRSNHSFLLQVPKMKCKTFGDRGFHVAGPIL